MPPSTTTPPCPSETLFKSSLRPPPPPRPPAAVEPGSNISGSSWPPALSAAHLDHTQWTYLAEGGKNILLRFDGDVETAKNGWVNQNASRALALRLVKRDRGEKEVGATASSSSSSSSSPSSSSSSSAPPPSRPHFEAAVIAPLLGTGKEALLPPTARISLAKDAADHSVFLEKIAAKIELARPVERRRKTGVDLLAGFVDFVEDLTWATPGNEVVAVEIKPKWLFSTGEHSRYKKHRVLKSQGRLTLQEWNALYDPLDLVSGDESRIERATSALVEDWERGGNNLCVFMNGQAIQDSKSVSLQRQLSHLKPSPSRDPSSTLASILKQILSSSNAQSVLRRLAHLQSSLAPLDIHTLSAWWSAQTGGLPFGEANDSTSSLCASPTLEEYQEFAMDWLQIQGAEEGNENPSAPPSSSLALTLRQAILGTLLSATFKDCSIFLRLGPQNRSRSDADPRQQEDRTPLVTSKEMQSQTLTSLVEEASSTTSSLSTRGDSSYLETHLIGKRQNASPCPPSSASSDFTHLGYTLRLVDLDMKPLAKLPYWLHLEGELETSFQMWKMQRGL